MLTPIEPRIPKASFQSPWTFSLLLALMLAGGGLLTGCAGNGQAATNAPEGSSTEKAARTEADEKDADEKEEEAVPVELTRLERGRIESVLRFSSNLEAESDVQVVSQAARLVRELLVEEGDRVRKGQILLRLQDDEQRNNLSKIRSQLERSRREHLRQKRLFEDNLISEQRFNDAAFDMEQLEIALADAERELGYTEVKAPISGTITERKAKLGDQVNLNQHLFSMVDFDSIVARVFVPEKNLPLLKKGLTARISAQALGDREYIGRIDRISPVVDPRTGTLKVTVAVGGQPGLRPGLYVDVALVTAIHEEAIRVPRRALIYDQDRMFVYRMGKDSRVQRVAVEPVLSDKEYVEPRSRLDEGDLIVTAGQAGLKNGSLVTSADDAAGEGASAAPAAQTAEKRS